MKKLLLLLCLIHLLNTNAQNIITTVAGNGAIAYTGDGGPEISAATGAIDVKFDASGNMFIVDVNNNVIRKVNTAGVITTVVGNGVAGFSGDGGPANAAQLNYPNAIAFDATGNLYISDGNNGRVRKVDAAGVITTFAGGGTGPLGDGGAAIAATLSTNGITCNSGNLYIADNSNQRIRKVSASGIITTVAGNGTPGFSGDGGPATSAKLLFPTSTAFDIAGNMYISDGANVRIRKVSTGGIITTYAGNGTQGYSGDGGPAASAELFQPTGIFMDGSDNLYIADQLSNRIRKVSNTGIITTIAGNGTRAFSGDGGQATSAELNWPWGVCIHAGNLYIADTDNYRIRKVTIAVGVEQYAGINTNIIIYPNPTNGQVTIETDAIDKQVVDVYDISGRNVFNQTIIGTTKIDISILENGIYNLLVKSNLGVTNKKIVITK